MQAVFWIIALCVIGGVEVWMLAAEVFAWSFLAFGLFVAGMYYFLPSLASWVVTVHWTHLLVYSVIYLMVGAAVAILKWMQFVGRKSEPIKVLLKLFNKAYKPEWFAEYTAHWNPTPEQKKAAEEQQALERKQKEEMQRGAGIHSLRASPPPKIEESKEPPHPVNESAFRRAAFLECVKVGKIITIGVNNNFAPWNIKHLMEERAFLEEITPNATQHKVQISAWTFEWPFVIVATVFQDVLLRFGHHVAEFIQNTLGGMSRAIMGRATKGL